MRYVYFIKFLPENFLYFCLNSYFVKKIHFMYILDIWVKMKINDKERCKCTQHLLYDFA